MEIKEFLKQFEGVDLEFRAKFKNDEDRDRDIKVISSFFNGRGGTLLFGVSEDGTTRTIVGTDMELFTYAATRAHSKLRMRKSPIFISNVNLNLTRRLSRKQE